MYFLDSRGGYQCCIQYMFLMFYGNMLHVLMPSYLVQCLLFLLDHGKKLHPIIQIPPYQFFVDVIHLCFRNQPGMTSAYPRTTDVSHSDCLRAYLFWHSRHVKNATEINEARTHSPATSYPRKTSSLTAENS